MECSIRPFRPEDAAALALAVNNRRVQDNLRDGLPYPYTEADGLDYIRSVLAADPAAVFAYAILADGRVAGSIALYRQQNIHFRTAELGYYLGEADWGKGLCSRAVGLACRRVFQETDILRIFAEPFAYNAASCRVLEKNGFRFEGTLRCNAVKNGRVLDMHLYALLREDWAAGPR